MSRIQVCPAGNISEGEYICSPDADYPRGFTVPLEDYEPSEQDWQHVIKIGGHADVGYMILAYHSGEQYRVNCDWSQDVWREIEDDTDEPVRDEVE